MGLRIVPATLLFAALCAHYSCSVDAVELEGKECPCAAGYTCDPRTQVCIIGNATGGAAGAAGAAGTTAGGGSGGSADASSGGKGGTSASDSGGSDVSSGGAASGGAGGSASGGSGGAASGGAGGSASGGSGGSASGGAGGTTGGSKNSCVGHCDLIDTPVPGSSPKCYCDDACEGFDDCCVDKIKVCGAAPKDAGPG
ncbi:MAG: hypothetical protein U0263_28835 [Polyangiaceae bacterium]